MKFYQDLETKKKDIREYLRKNQTATFRDIKKYLHTKVNKVYLGGMNEAYKDAGISPPRNFQRKSVEEKRRIIIDYIKKNPKAGGQIIRKETKINYLTIFKDSEKMFREAGVVYPRKDIRKLKLRKKELRKKEMIELIRNNPLLSIKEIGKRIRTHPYQIFKNTKELYKEAGIEFIDKSEKRISKKRVNVVSFIKKNNLATQREINRACKTHVQLIFEEGIFGAYKEAGVEFPYERLKLHGAAIKEIKEDAIKFEEEIARILSGYGRVNRLVKTKRGFADIILERKNKKIVVEIKNYKSHQISISQIKQLNKYLEDTECQIGFLICLKKPKKDTFLMGRNKIIVLESSELHKIPELTDKDP